MAKFSVATALLTYLALHNGVDAFGVPKSVQRALTRTTFSESLTQLNAEGSKITMPALSSTMKEGKVVSWLKSEGDEIEAGEAIMVVESDKADMDVEAFEDGVLAKIIVGEGEMAPVGEAVALIAADESEVASVISSFEGGATAAPATESAPAAEESGGELPDHTEIFMPALSSTMSEGKVVEWLKKVGDFVEAGEALMVVESDKADMDVEAFEDGYLAAIVKEEGEMADVGAPVGILVSTEADISAFSSNPPVATSPTTTSAVGASAAAAPDCEFSQIDMPALSSTMKEGKVVSWLKGEGDAISAGEAIMVVESDKADMDVEAFEDGFLAAIITGEGETGAVGAPVALIAAEESDIPALQAYAATLSGAPAPAAPAASAAPAAPAAKAAAPKAAAATPAAASGERVTASPLARKKAEELGVDITSVAGTGPNGRITASDVEAAASGSAPAKKAAAAPAKPSWTPAAGVIPATPTARALAKKAKIDIASIQGTGSFGRVTADDVKMATGEKKPQRKRTVPGEEVVEMPSEYVPFTGMQTAVSNNMMATLEVPVFRTSREIEMDGFEALYQVN